MSRSIFSWAWVVWSRTAMMSRLAVARSSRVFSSCVASSSSRLLPLALSWTIPADMIRQMMADSITRTIRTLPAVDIRPLPLVSIHSRRLGREKAMVPRSGLGAGRSRQHSIHAPRRRCQGVAGETRGAATGLTGLRAAPYNRVRRPGRPRVPRGESARHASHLSRHRAPGRRHRPGAVAGGPPPGRGAADPPRLRAGRFQAGEPPGARQGGLRRGRRDDRRHPGRARSTRRPRPRRAPTRSSGAGSTSRSSTGRSTRSPACRPTSAASSTWTSCGSPPAGPTTTPAG